MFHFSDSNVKYRYTGSGNMEYRYITGSDQFENR